MTGRQDRPAQHARLHPARRPGAFQCQPARLPAGLPHAGRRPPARDQHSHGHVGGDRAIATVASVLTEHLRDEDLAARFGGEEFAVALPHTDLRQAAEAAERIRLAIEAPPPVRHQAAAGHGLDRREPVRAERQPRRPARLRRPTRSTRPRTTAGTSYAWRIAAGRARTTALGEPPGQASSSMTWTAASSALAPARRSRRPRRAAGDSSWCAPSSGATSGRPARRRSRPRTPAGLVGLVGDLLGEPLVEGLALPLLRERGAEPLAGRPAVGGDVPLVEHVSTPRSTRESAASSTPSSSRSWPGS